MADLPKISVLVGIYLLFLFPLSACQQLPGKLSSTMENVIYLQPGLVLRIKNPSDIDIFCFVGHEKDFLRAWETVMIKTHLSPDVYDQYVGFSPEEVAEEYDLHHYSWRFSLLHSKENVVQVNPFNQSCVGVHVHKKQPYKIELILIRVDYWRILMAAAGIVLFSSARKLSSNPLFYYLCGVTAGICLSFVALVYVLSKLFPKKPMMYGFVIGGWTVSLYIFQLLWSNFRMVLDQYHHLLIGYVVSVGILSFAFCYRFGPVTDPRSINLIKWTLQGAGLFLFIQSSWFIELMACMCIILLVAYNIPAIWIGKLKLFWTHAVVVTGLLYSFRAWLRKRRFPPRVRLLNEDEYHEQGVRETQKALQELRGYCSSPECDAWRTVLKIQNPIRFAEFMSGQSHLQDEEILAYESESGRVTPTGRGECDESESEEDDVVDYY